MSPSQSDPIFLGQPMAGQDLKFRILGERIRCKRIYGKQTKWTNQIGDDILQEILQIADKMDKLDTRGYVARDFTKSRQNGQTR